MQHGSEKSKMKLKKKRILQAYMRERAYKDKLFEGVK